MTIDYRCNENPIFLGSCFTQVTYEYKFLLILRNNSRLHEIRYRFEILGNKINDNYHNSEIISKKFQELKIL